MHWFFSSKSYFHGTIIYHTMPIVGRKWERVSVYATTWFKFKLPLNILRRDVFWNIESQIKLHVLTLKSLALKGKFVIFGNFSFIPSDCSLSLSVLPCSHHVGKGNIDVSFINKTFMIQLINSDRNKYILSTIQDIASIKPFRIYLCLQTATDIYLNYFQLIGP